MRFHRIPTPDRRARRRRTRAARPEAMAVTVDEARGLPLPRKPAPRPYELARMGESPHELRTSSATPSATWSTQSSAAAELLRAYRTFCHVDCDLGRLLCFPPTMVSETRGSLSELPRDPTWPCLLYPSLLGRSPGPCAGDWRLRRHDVSRAPARWPRVRW